MASTLFKMKSQPDSNFQVGSNKLSESERAQKSKIALNKTIEREREKEFKNNAKESISIDAFKFFFF